MMWPVPSGKPSHPYVPWNSPELHDGVRAIALQRVVAVPLLAVAGFAQADTHVVPFAILAALALVVELLQARVLYSDRWASVPLPQLLMLDIALIAVAVALTGGAQSPVAYIGLLTLFTGTFAFGPVYISWLCAWVLLTSGGVVIADGLIEGDSTAVVTYLTALLFTTIVCFNAARVREVASRNLRELAAARRRLVVDAAQAEARDRKRISQQLHDAALQSLLAARQDLEEVAAGDPEALQFARDALQTSVDAVRDLVYDIDPAALAGSRLPEALRGLVDRLTLADGAVIKTTIQSDAAGVHDELLHAVARELLRHATRESGARHITVALRRDDALVHLEVTDDGHRLKFDAHAEGTVGIAAAAARVDAAGGTLRIGTLDGDGTRIVVRLPDAPAA
ncbi:MAG: integral rane sensor signal transduction histidine kinase [Solirubrobacterales bacterium]|nr:integral rane sensor signal transduction histidine kinase [Solirubrobacterales bacterium]